MPPPIPPVETLSVPPVITAVIAKPMPTRLQSALQKQKVSFQDQIRETSELEWTNWLSIAQIQTEGKTTRQEIKEGKHHKTALDIEHSCVSHAREEAECQHQHEMLIWEKKLELARLQAGVLPQSAEPSQAHSFTSLLNSTSGVQGLSFGTHSSTSSSSGGHHPSPSTPNRPFGWGAEVALPGYTDDMGSGDNQLYWQQ